MLPRRNNNSTLLVRILSCYWFPRGSRYGILHVGVLGYRFRTRCTASLERLILGWSAQNGIFRRRLLAHRRLHYISNEARTTPSHQPRLSDFFPALSFALFWHCRCCWCAGRVIEQRHRSEGPRDRRLAPTTRCTDSRSDTG